MIEAYHMIGLSNRDQGRMQDETYHQDIITNARKRYLQVVHDGYLQPASVFPDTPTMAGQTFTLDRLAGDDQYVFLSIGKRYWNQLAASNFGFIFDAEKLLDDGAIVRKRDLLQDYGDLLDEVVEHFIPFSHPSTWTRAQLDALFQEIEGKNHL